MSVADEIRESMDRSSWIRKMFEEGASLKSVHGAENVFDFSLGNPDLSPPASFSRALSEIIREDIPMKHAYMPNAGYPEVREKMASFLSDIHGISLNGSQIIMTCGAGGALNVILKVLLNQGDEVLVSTPCFMEYLFYTANHGGVLKMVNSREDFDLDIEAISEGLSDRTKALIINSPNNPSGRVYPEKTINSLAKLLRDFSAQRGRPVFLISDEPYRNIIYDDTRVPSILSAYENSVVASSFSKELSIPGERIGYLAVNPQAADVSSLMDACVLCNRILGFVNAPALMQRTVARLLGEKVDIGPYVRRREILCDGLSEIGYRFKKPEGTFYLFPQAPGGDDLEAVRVLQEEKILTVPGRGFGSPGYFRISFCVNEKVIKNAMPGFKRAYEKLNQKA